MSGGLAVLRHPSASSWGWLRTPIVRPVRIAAADLGSNSLHLLIVQAHPDGSFDTLVQEKEMLRLGDVVSREGRISDTAASTLLECLGRFRTMADNFEAEVVAYATSAMREAENSADVVDRIEDETDIRVRVISGRDEARLIFGAVRASVVLDPAPALCLDLGGGSLEVMVGDAGGLLWSDSVKLGVARLSSELVRNDPLKADDVRRVRRRAEAVLTPLAEEVADFRSQMLVGTSGTLCDLARMAALRNGGDPAALANSVNQLKVRRKDLNAVHQQILELSSAERAKLDGLEGRRADIVAAGSVVLQVAMDLFGLDELTVGEWALREGMVLDAIGHHDPADWADDPKAPRRASVLSLARRCSWDEGHSSQVARLALDLFDQTRLLHRLGEDDRELLEFGALLHDIGEHVAIEAHHKHSAYLIQNGKLRGFSPAEVAMLATMGRFHRRGDPKSSFEPYAGLSSADQRRATVLTGLLRVADGLDRSHSGVVDSVDVDVGPERIRVVAHASGEAELDRWGVRRKAELLERALDRRLDVTMLEAHHLLPEDEVEARGA